MMPILARIDQKIAASSSPLAIAELRAERVCYMARAGDFERSLQVLQEIRGDKLLSSSPRVMVWVMLAEGVLGYFKELDPRSRDRLLRAYGIACAAKLADLELICASWLAHTEFNRSDFDSMATYVRKYATGAPTGTDAAAGRIALVLADANLYAGEHARSARWYESARRIAVDLGDEATIGAIMHDRAALNSSRARVNEVLGVQEDEPLRFLRLEIESSESFHRATGQVALKQVTDVVKARVLQIEGRYSEAAELYLPIVARQLSTSLLADDCLLRAELASCLLNAGQHQGAAIELESISLMSSTELGRDDRVVFWHCIHELAVGLADHQLTASASAHLEMAKQSYVQEMSSLKLILAELEDLMNRP